jgi:hypothetical protein
LDPFKLKKTDLTRSSSCPDFSNATTVFSKLGGVAVHGLDFFALLGHAGVEGRPKVCILNVVEGGQLIWQGAWPGEGIVGGKLLRCEGRTRLAEHGHGAGEDGNRCREYEGSNGSCMHDVTPWNVPCEPRRIPRKTW